MRAIFISYRREDSEGHAGRLFDDLAAHFGKDSVFMDVVDIEPGRDFRRVIDQQVASCGVLLAVIGKGWCDAKDQVGRRRLDDPGDFVRLETASALKRDIPVIPVLVHGAAMPRAEDLPQELQELAYRNGVELTHARWDSDVQVLINVLRPHVDAGPNDAGDVSAEAAAGSAGGASATDRTPAVRVAGGAAPDASARPAKQSRRAVVVASLAVVVVAIGGLATYQRSKAIEKPAEPTGWMSFAELREQLRSQPKDTRFPDALEARCTAEGRVELRARFGPLPKGKSEFSWGVADQAAQEQHVADLTARGFTLFARQTCAKPSGEMAYTSVWVK